jgi:hypothetical protein
MVYGCHYILILCLCMPAIRFVSKSSPIDDVINPIPISHCVLEHCITTKKTISVFRGLIAASATDRQKAGDFRSIGYSASRMSTSYDDSLAMQRKLTADEIKELRLTLLPYFHAMGISNNEDFAPEDISDFVDYAMTMFSNGRPVDSIIKELSGLGMTFFPAEIADKVGKVMSDFIQTTMSGDKEVDDGDGGEDIDNGGRGATLQVRLLSLGFIRVKKQHLLNISRALALFRQRHQAKKGMH